MLTFNCNTSNSMYFCTKNCILASEETWDMHHPAICGQYNMYWCYAELRRNVLELLHPESVLQRHWASAAIPTEYFRIMDPHLPLTMEPCGHCYEQDELQMVHYTQSIYFDPAAWLEQNCLSCKVFCQEWGCASTALISESTGACTMPRWTKVMWCMCAYCVRLSRLCA